MGEIEKLAEDFYTLSFSFIEEVLFLISPNSSFRICSPNQTFSNNNNNDNNNIVRKSKKPHWNTSTRLHHMDPHLSQEVTMDVFSLTREIHTPIGPPMNASERATTPKDDKPMLPLKRSDILPNVKIYNLWSQHLSKDQITAEAAWNRCRLITEEALEKFGERLDFLENVAAWEITAEILLEFQSLEEKKGEIEAGLFEVEDYDIEIKEVAKATQNVAQYLAPIEEREELKMKIVTLRRRYFKVLQELCKKKEMFRWLLPLLEQYRDQGCDIKSWLDVTESRTEFLTSNFNNNEIIVKNEDLIEEIKEELFVQKDAYEDFLNASEGIMDLLSSDDEVIIQIRTDHDHVVSRWDTLCSNIEKCLNRLVYAKKVLSEQSRTINTDPEKIEKKIRNEAKQCTCHKPFQITRVGEGKYTFGTSKIVRLVRVHGSSIVVRVGGGWEYLYDFLFKADPCRAKQAMEAGSQEMKSLNLSGLDLTPIDKKSSNFNLNVTRMTPKSWTPYRPNRYERSASLGSAASSSDNIDYDESSDSMSLSTSTGPSTPLSRPSSRIEYTPNMRKSSADNNNSKLLGSLATMNSKNNRRLSLIERQAIYAEKKKMAQAYEDRKF
ncbi:uncharacterized protein [Clytia hemisphaerica]|uniref:uncharacterized protein isoform X4 n=1 Tax=Clytia hemisphaerica TaxID=252671 RepID=UPI0034D4645C